MYIYIYIYMYMYVYICIYIYIYIYICAHTRYPTFFCMSVTLFRLLIIISVDDMKAEQESSLTQLWWTRNETNQPPSIVVKWGGWFFVCSFVEVFPCRVVCCTCRVFVWVICFAGQPLFLCFCVLFRFSGGWHEGGVRVAAVPIPVNCICIQFRLGLWVQG